MRQRFAVLLIVVALSAENVCAQGGSQQNRCAPGELRSYSTLHSIGVEWDVAGDANHNASCAVRYRAAGQKDWKEALPLFRVDFSGWYADTKADRPYNMLAGSVLFLNPGTAYEVKLDLADPDGGANSRMLSIETRPAPSLPKDGRTFHVAPGVGGGDGSARHPFQGLAAAQAAARPADVFLLHKGMYGTFTFERSGALGRYIVWKAAGDGEAQFEHIPVTGSHLWFEGLTLKRGTVPNGLKGDGAVEDVVVSRNSFDGFSYSVFLNKACRGWYIADNVIVGDNDPSKSNMSGEGVELGYSSGNVVAFNRISRTADGISYPGRNCDMYGNDIFDVSDDGLEPDYGYANNRMWGNRLTNCFNAALSFQPQYCGPWYFIRNQAVARGTMFKFRVQDRFVLAHNTLVRWGPMDGRMHHLFTGMSRNNLFISLGGKSPVWQAYASEKNKYTLLDNFVTNWMTDVDYDGFDWGDSPVAFRWNKQDYADLRSFSEAMGIEKHGIRVRKEEIFEKWDLPEEYAPVAPPQLTLKAGCNAIDAGAILPNINVDYAGKAPDLGAYEFGRPLPHYGPRR